MGLIQFKMDGPLDASPIHGAAGIWGLLAVGLFADNDGAAPQDLFYAGNLDNFLYQIVGILVMCTWCMGFTRGSFTTASTSTRRPFSKAVDAGGITVCSKETMATLSQVFPPPA
jgi:Amt family ammonium transporter